MKKFNKKLYELLSGDRSRMVFSYTTKSNCTTFLQNRITHQYMFGFSNMNQTYIKDILFDEEAGSIVFIDHNDFSVKLLYEEDSELVIFNDCDRLNSNCYLI